MLLKRKMRFYGPYTNTNTMDYNLIAFKGDAVFGCGARMDILMYPLAALLRSTPNPRVLIVGPRTEDDIFLGKALGLYNTRGLDIFSYSPYIDVGDMHCMPYPNESYDAVILGWALVYSNDPAGAVTECQRILKPNGFLGIGWEWASDPAKSDIRGNTLNEPAELFRLVEDQVVFLHDPRIKTNHHKAVIWKHHKSK